MRLTIWLLLLLVATHSLYEFAEKPYAVFMMGHGATIAVLLWHIRGPIWKARWWLCLWGAVEGWQVFVCQGLQNWFPRDIGRFQGACEAYFPVPTYAWGMFAMALIAGLIVSEATNGHRPPNS